VRSSRESRVASREPLLVVIEQTRLRHVWAISCRKPAQIGPVFSLSDLHHDPHIYRATSRDWFLPGTGWKEGEPATSGMPRP
jgi:hypothetical protein